MKTTKRILALFLSLALLACLLPAAGAAEAVDFEGLRISGEQQSPADLEVLAEPQFVFSFLNGFSGDYAVYETYDGMSGIMDCHGNALWQVPSEEIDIDRPFPSGFAIARSKDGENGPIYTVNGKQLTKKSDFPDYLQTGYNERFAEVPDYATGETSCISAYYYSSNPQTSEHPTWMLIVNRNGEQMAADNFGLCFDGRITFKEQGKWGLRRMFGETLMPCEYDDLQLIAADRLLAKRNGEYEILDLQGNSLLSIGAYEDASLLRSKGRERILVQKDGKWGLIDYAGKLLIAPEWEQLSAINTEKGPFFYSGRKEGKQWLLGEPDTGARIQQREWEDNCFWIGEGVYVYQICTGDNLGIEFVDKTGKRLIDRLFENWTMNWTLNCNDSVFLAQPAGDDAQAVTYAYSLDDLRQLGCYDNDARVTSTSIVSWNSESVSFYTLDGSLIRTVACEGASVLEGDIVLLHRDGKTVFCDAQGNLLKEYLDSVSPGTESGLGFIRKDGQIYVLNRKGEQLLDYPIQQWNRIDVDEPTHYINIVRDGKTGIVRYYAPGERTAFRDVGVSAWYAKGITFCDNAGLMKGEGEGRFNPNGSMTRAMMAQVLYNISGEKTASYGFTDVKSSAWYAKAVNWAAANGIVNGVTKTEFAPNASVTREQMVAILYRYACRFGDMKGDRSLLNKYEDGGTVSSYARTAMAWAVDNGIVKGATKSTLNPRGTATRAEIATILMRFINYMAARQ